MSNLNFDIKKYSKNDLYDLLGINDKNNQEEVRQKINKFKDASIKLPESQRFQYSKFIDDMSNILTGNIAGPHPFINRSVEPKIKAITDGNELSQGIINPLNKTYLNKIINIDTRFRDNYYTTKSTDFLVTIPTNLGKVVSMNLVALEMQSTFYTFSEDKRTNFFWITVTSGGVPYTSKIIIPDGNYTASELIAFINSTLTTLGAPYDTTQFFYDSTANGTGSQRIIYGLKSGSPVTNLELNFLKDENGVDDAGFPIILKAGWIFGYRNAVYNGLSIVSEGVYRVVSSPAYLYFCVDDFNNNVLTNFTNIFNDSVYNNNILARISVGSSIPPYNVLSIGNAITNKRTYMGPVEVKKIRIQIVDEYGNIVNLNNMDYSFSLQLQCLYDL